MKSCCICYAEALKIAGGHIPTAERLDASDINYTVIYKDEMQRVFDGYFLTPNGPDEQFRFVDVFDEIVIEGVILVNDDMSETDILDDLTKQDQHRLHNYLERRETDR